jgi:hypothetical protein
VGLREADLRSVTIEERIPWLGRLREAVLCTATVEDRIWWLVGLREAGLRSATIQERIWYFVGLREAVRGWLGGTPDLLPQESLESPQEADDERYDEERLHDAIEVVGDEI